MSLQNTPLSERLHIGLFGCRNAGKSSLINAITGQALSIVSPVAGTTTDPVQKTMELLPLGPVVLIDTPGLDDVGELGGQRIEKTWQVLRKCDLALLAIDSLRGPSETDFEIIERLKAQGLPFLLALTKSDLCSEAQQTALKARFEALSLPAQSVSVHDPESIYRLKETLATLPGIQLSERRIIGDLLAPGDMVVLVVPIDKAAPKGRLILPQQQTIRDILDSDAQAVVVKETQLEHTLSQLSNVRMVVTDSQAFAFVNRVTPPEIPLTSFSILFARYKADLRLLLHGAQMLKQLRPNDHILISEGCTHHRQCDDIGTVKLPRMLQSFCGFPLRFSFSSGNSFPEDLGDCRLVIHCGACMLNPREIQYRLQQVQAAKLPITNYGVAMAYMQGILPRCLKSMGIEMAHI